MVDANITVTATADTTSLESTVKDSKKKLTAAEKAARALRARQNRIFREIRRGARASYLMMQGIGRIMGGSMTTGFRTMYAMVTSAIGATAAIAQAIKFSGPAGWVQAGLMSASLVTASIQLAGVMTGNQKLIQIARGVNMTVHSISAIADTIPVRDELR